jgi:hypothetical protein
MALGTVVEVKIVKLFMTHTKWQHLSSSEPSGVHSLVHFWLFQSQITNIGYSQHAVKLALTEFKYLQIFNLSSSVSSQPINWKERAENLWASQSFLTHRKISRKQTKNSKNFEHFD